MFFRKKEKEIKLEIEIVKNKVTEKDLGALEYINTYNLEAYKNIDNEELIILKNLDQTFSTLLEVLPVDLSSMSYGEQNHVLGNYFEGMKLYDEKYKIITENIQYNHSPQLELIKNLKIELEKNYDQKLIPKNIYLLKKQELNRQETIIKSDFVSRNRKVRFFIVLYGKSKNEIMTNYRDFFNNFFNPKVFEIKKLSIEETKEIIIKNNNPFAFTK